MNMDQTSVSDKAIRGLLPAEFEELDNLVDKLLKCLLVFEELYRTPTVKALEKINESFGDLASTGLGRCGYDPFAGDRPFEFRGEVTTSMAALFVRNCAGVLLEAKRTNDDSDLIPEIPPEELRRIVEIFYIENMSKWFYYEYSIAVGKLRQEAQRSVSLKTSVRLSKNRLSPKISIPQLWRMIEGRRDATGCLVATGIRTLYDWRKHSEWPSDTSWESVRAWVLTYRHIDIGECEIL